MKKIKRIMAVLICMTITLTGIPVSVNAENSGGKVYRRWRQEMNYLLHLRKIRDIAGM